MDREILEKILGRWLIGEHLEDVSMISPEEFGELQPVVNEIIAGETDPFTICKRSGINHAEISQLVHGSSEYLYTAAMSRIIKERRAAWIRDHAEADPDRLMEYLQETRREWMEPAKALEDPAAAFAGYLGTLDDRQNAKTLRSGIEKLDNLTGGIFPGTLTAIGARPAVGKTAFVLNVAAHVAEKGGKVLFLALEMTTADILDRWVLMYSWGIEPIDLRRGLIDPLQWDEIERVGEKFEASGIIIDHERDLQAIEKIIAKIKPDLVIIDQLTQLVDNGQRFSSIRERYCHMTAGLKRLAMENSCAIWLACQVNRAGNGESESSRPTLERLKESGSIEEDADNVILLSRCMDEERIQNFHGNRIINIELAKHRNGQVGEFHMKLEVKRLTFKPLEEDRPDDQRISAEAHKDDIAQGRLYDDHLSDPGLLPPERKASGHHGRTTGSLASKGLRI